MAPETMDQARKRKREEKASGVNKKIKSQDSDKGAPKAGKGYPKDAFMENGKMKVRMGERVVSLEQWEKQKRERKAAKAAQKLKDEEVKKETAAKIKSENGVKPEKPKKKKIKAPEAELVKAEEKVVVHGDTTQGAEMSKARLNKFKSKRNKTLANFLELEGRQKRGEDVSEELEELVEKAERLIKGHGGDAALPKDDELSKKIAQHSTHTGRKWYVTETIGGRFLKHDPVFSHDEKYIFLATSKGVHVYDTATSLLVRTLSADDVSSYALSSSDRRNLYMGTLHGSLHLVDWTTGRQLWKVQRSKTTQFRSIAIVQLPGTLVDTMFTIETHPSKHKKDRGPESQIVRDLFSMRIAPWDESDAALQVLSYGHGPLHHLKVLDSGRAVLVAGDMALIVGCILKADSHLNICSLEKIAKKYRWKELHPTLPITAMDGFARSISQGATTNDRQRSKKSYDVAIGNAKGEVLVYQNLVEHLPKTLDGDHKGPQPRVLHWHREAPSTVKWSLDGNYILSGGKETVLCLWQLETGKRQELPHLTSAITGLTVSPEGISYGVHLVDNSVMVLSTTELKAKAHIAGMQSLCISTTSKSKYGLSDNALDLYTLTPLVNNPRNPKEILLAVPVTQFVNELTSVAPPAPILQTYDVAAARHVSRQALTRNMATDVSIDPYLKKIEIPNVTHLQISHDGLWLATVEEWIPSSHSLEHLAYELAELDTERRKRRESYIKIWSWNAATSMWELNTRVDTPHRSETDECANRVFDLVAHPTKAGFATIGEDSVLRVWKPKARKGAISWVAKTRSDSEKSAASTDPGLDFPVAATPIIARLAYSNDGSVLAVCQQDERKAQTGVVHLLDAETCETKSAETGLSAGYLLAMGFLDRYLILLSKEVRVWDVVTSTLVYSKNLRSLGTKLTLWMRVATTHLAVDVASGVFAVAGVDVCEGKSGSGVLVLEPTSVTPVGSFALGGRGAVTALKPLLSAEGGFVVVDSNAEVRRVVLKKATGAAVVEDAIVRVEEVTPEDEDTEDEEDEPVGAVVAAKVDFRSEAGVSSRDQLAKALVTANGHTFPAVSEMFGTVEGYAFGKEVL